MNISVPAERLLITTGRWIAATDRQVHLTLYGTQAAAARGLSSSVKGAASPSLLSIPQARAQASIRAAWRYSELGHVTQRYSAALLPQSNDCRSSASAGLRTRSQPRAFHYPMLIPGPWLSLPRADQPARLTSNTSPGSPSRYSLCVGVSPAAESKRERGTHSENQLVMLASFSPGR